MSEVVVFLIDGEHFVSGGSDGKIRCWQTKDGKEVGVPMETGDAVLDIAASRDGKWVACGSVSCGVTVWDVESHEKVPIEFKTNEGMVFAIDVSPDGATIATGSADLSVCVWSLSTGERLLGPLEHDNVVVGVKFSPAGCLIATAMEDQRNSVRIYNSQDGRLLVEFPITISDSASNQSLAWASDSKQLFALSRDGSINCLDVSAGTTLFHWSIHSHYPPTAIALASNGTFIAVAAGTSVSFWDTAAYERIGPIIEHAAPVASMAMSANYDIVTTTGYTITLRQLCDILPSYVDVIVHDWKTSPPLSVKMADLEGIVDFSGAQDGCSGSKIAHLEQEISLLKGEVAQLGETVKSLVNTIQDLRTELAESKRNADSAVGSLVEGNEGSDKRIARNTQIGVEHTSIPTPFCP
ncbi:WD40-repeat-containing domain protein [Boletus edulis BED1]|uniref:WD40-repeat-containing domain protein n=1 Tax=Boletus edulis BED1 TaxID=1328754 RepID=A0AAD4GC59_BOLED|nr:WD40-repeat-containing domain protein [Boletus edulis BED1]